jgi:hypothetical protein
MSQVSQHRYVSTSTDCLPIQKLQSSDGFADEVVLSTSLLVVCLSMFSYSMYVRGHHSLIWDAYGCADSRC